MDLYIILYGIKPIVFMFDIMLMQNNYFSSFDQIMSYFIIAKLAYYFIFKCLFCISRHK